MPRNDDYITYLMDLFRPFGPVQAKAMFGGYGVYHRGLMIGLVADETLYLKVDGQNKKEFESQGLEPFVYNKKGKPMAMSYHEAPGEAMDNPHEMTRWAQSAYGAAQRAARKKPSKKKKN